MGSYGPGVVKAHNADNGISCVWGSHNVILGRILEGMHRKGHLMKP